MYKFLSYLLTSCLIMISMCLSASAQSSSATLSGTVVDENNAVIPGAGITVQNRATSLERHATTNDSGSFTIPLLPPGEYTVLVEREGFTRVQLTNIVLNVGDQKAVQVQLKVGDVQSTVEVRPDATLLRTDGSVGTTIDQQFVRNLPLNGRSFQSLILLTPGVVVTNSSNQSPGQFSVNGQRSNANYFTVDGVSANTGTFNLGNVPGALGTSQSLAGVVPGLTSLGGTNGLVSIDALQEFKIQTSSYSAEFGRQPGGQISLVTRRGTNQFSGTLFEYLRNDVFDANDWFVNAVGREKAPLRQNQFGGTFSGPVFVPNIGDGGSRWYSGRNRTFFLVSYEGLRLRLPQAVVTTVPSLRLRAAAAASVRPILAAFPLPDGTELLNTAGQPSGLSPFTGVYSDPSAFNATSIRIDHMVNENLTLFGRFNNAPSDSSTRDGRSQVSENKIMTRSLTLGATLVLTSRLSNELRFNISGDKSKTTVRLDDFGGAVPIDLASAISPDFSSRHANTLSSVSVTLPLGTRSFRVGPADAINQHQINLVDNVSWLKGGHQLKFGIDYRRLAPIYTPVSFQNVIFNGEAQIRSATVNRVDFVSRLESRPLFTNVSVYGQDTWKLSRRLTLDVGVRWDINPAPEEADGKKPVGVIGAENLPTATLGSPDTTIYKTYYRALAPRIGVAYQLSDVKGRERVVRGGFGIFYDTGSGPAANGFTQFPFRSESISRNVPFPIAPALAVTPPVVVRLPITQPVYALDPDLTLPYTLQWNVSMEQSLGADQTVSASYVASAGRDLLTFQILNRANAAGQRINSNFAELFFISNGAASDYHSLQLQFQRRLTKGLQALANYTWSHAIDEVSSEITTGVLERGSADFDVRHNFSSAITYNLPKPGAGVILKRVFENWWVDAVVHAQSGAPVDLFARLMNREDGTEIRVRPDLILGQPLYIEDSSVAGGRRFNSAAFQTPPVGRQGTLGRNVLRGLPLHQVDLALRRQFNLTEIMNLQLRAEAFNVFNHPNFGGFAVSSNSPSTLGVPTVMLGRSLGGLSSLYQIGGPRSLQFSLKLNF